MALIKAIETSQGAIAEYWRVVEVTHNYLAQQTQVILNGYVDEAKRRAGKEPLAGLKTALPPDAFIPDGTRQAIYAALKAQPAFAGAADAIEGAPAGPSGPLGP